MDKVYQFSTTDKTWELARKECEEWGGQLVTITSKEQNDYLVEELNLRSVYHIWREAFLITPIKD